MKRWNAPDHHISHRIARIAYATVLAVALALSLSQSAQADKIVPPPVPIEIQVPEGHTAFLQGHGTGTQNYICLPSGSGFAWTLFTPEATLFDDDREQVTTHFFSPNPFEKDTIRATWQHSRDSSIVWAQLVRPFSDPPVAEGAIPWLLLQAGKGRVQAGPTGGDKLTVTTFVQRLNTSGGSAPATGCASLSDVGTKAFVPYTADYFFYKGPDNTDAEN